MPPASTVSTLRCTKHSPHAAIVHAHPQAAIAASLVMDRIIPEDSEGVMFCPEIPVVGGAPGSQEVADNVAAALARGKLVIARGHGTFAAGKNLDEAYQLTSLAEHSCRVIALKREFQNGDTFFRILGNCFLATMFSRCMMPPSCATRVEEPDSSSPVCSLRRAVFPVGDGAQCDNPQVRASYQVQRGR